MKSKLITTMMITLFLASIVAIAIPVNASVTVTAPASIQAAIDANPGAVIYLSGVFSQSVTLDSADSGITLTSADSAVLDGTGPADAGTTLDPNFAIRLLDGVSDVTIENLEIRDYGGWRGSAISAWDVSTSNITVINNYIHDNNWNGILVGSEGGYVHDNWMVKNNQVENNGFAGIELTNSENSTIMRNDVDGGWFGIVVQARNTISGSGLVAIDGVHILHNTIDGATYYGIYILSFTGHPTAFTPITGASSLLTSVNVKHNTITNSGSVASILFWAYNDAATAKNGRIMKNEITPPTSGIWILERGSSGEEGTVENVKVVNNAGGVVTDEGAATKLPPGLGPYP